jgi:hypothetical protein
VKDSSSLSSTAENLSENANGLNVIPTPELPKEQDVNNYVFNQIVNQLISLQK